jgi:hypothetical protein
VDTLNAQTYAQGQLPKKYPYWEPNDDQDYQWLEWYQETLLGGIKEGGEKDMNMSKTIEVSQGPDESPNQFYELLCEAFHLYTPFNPQVAKNQRMINAVFVSQAQGNIRRQLQKLERFVGTNTSQLLEVATKLCQLRSGGQ